MENKDTFQEQNERIFNGEINDLQIHSKNKNIWNLYRGINEFKKNYQPVADGVKDEKGANFQIPTAFRIAGRNGCLLLNIHGGC
jgi:hypothetical protein